MNDIRKNIGAGIDIGGSHITIAQIDLDSLELLEETMVRERIDSGAGAEKIIEGWVNAIEKCLGNVGVGNVPIGIAMPGPFDFKEGVSYMQNQGKYDALYKINVKKILCKRLNLAEDMMTFDNDASCFLRGEMQIGELKKYHHAIGLTLGTGMGSAYMANQEIADANLWKTPFKAGIIEDYISSRWFVKTFYDRSGTQVRDVKDLIERYGDTALSKELFREFSDNLAAFLYFFLQKSEAELVILGGNIAKAQKFFLRETQRILYEKMGLSIPVFLSSLGENAALVGALCHYKNEHYKKNIVTN